MTTVTSTTGNKPSVCKRAKEFANGTLLIDNKGNLGLRTSSHIVRADDKATPLSLFVLDVDFSSDLFTEAPAGSSFTVSN